MNDNIVDVVRDIIKRDEKTKPYDTTAKVTRIDGNTAWVHIDGGVSETPVSLTIDAKEGDNVQVRLAGGRAWITGNATSPPTDDSTAKIAQSTANVANQNATVAAAAAQNAVESAEMAYNAAQSAEISANEAQISARQAQTSADQAHTQANYATTYANNALTQLSTVESVVDTLNWITSHSTFVPTTDTTVQAGKLYYFPADNALTLTDGTTQLNGLTFVVSGGTVTVSGTSTAYTSFNLGLPSVTAGDTIYLSGCTGGSSSTYAFRYYQAGGAVFCYNGTVKTTAINNAYSYIAVSNGVTMNNVVFTPRVSTANADGYEYEIVANPTGNPSTQGYFELDTTEAVRDFVKAHLALTNDGLYVLKDGSGWKVLISNDHIEIQDDIGNIVANFGETIALTAPDADATMEIYNAGLTLEDSAGGMADLKGDSLRIWDENHNLIANIGGGIQGGSGSTWGNFYALGQGLISHTDRSYQTIIGKYNNPSVNDIFEIGNGTSNSDRKNIFAVRANGIIDGENVLTYGTCDTAAATAAKTATVAFGSFTLQTGATIAIKFTNSNSVASPTLNVNGTGAKAIMRYGTTAPSTSAESSWNAGSVVTFLYDGTYWQMIGFNNTTYSSMSDAEYQAGTSTTARLITPARLKAAIAYWISKKASLFSSRQANANLTADGQVGVSHFIATSSMTSNKPGDGDGHIIHMAWDNNGGWDSQLYVQNGNTPKMLVRGQSNGTWGSWKRVYTETSKPTASDVGALPSNYFIFDTYSKSITISGGATSVTLGALTQHSGYTLRGYINQNGGYTDQWLVSYGTYGSNVVAMVYSKYNSSLTNTISCTAIWTKNL